jgi:hypothetical protein
MAERLNAAPGPQLGARHDGGIDDKGKARWQKQRPEFLQAI